MASSIVHLAIVSELIKMLDFSDPDRLKFGAVVADAGVKGNSHLKINVMDDKKKTYDLDGFRAMFGKKMLTDDLYLGYYLHLVQDALYRHYVYDRHHWNPTLQGSIEKLHKDYALVNPYLEEKYGLVNDLKIPDGFENEDINRLCIFDAPGFMKELATYFIPVPEEPVFFFTKEMSDEFIGEAVEYCIEEIRKIRNGEKGIDMMEYAWYRGGTPA